MHNNNKKYTFENQLRHDEKALIERFIKKTPISQYPIITPQGEIFITQKELLCLDLLSAGKSAKQIALKLKISHRTVEKHLENIRYKLQCHNKAKLIKIYKASIANWL